MNDITATRVPGYISGNKLLLYQYQTMVNEVMKNKEYKKKYVNAYMNDFSKFINDYCEFSYQYQRENTLTDKSRKNRSKNENINPKEKSLMDNFNVKTNFCRIPTWLFDILSFKHSLKFYEENTDKDLSTVKYLEGLKREGVISPSLSDKFILLIEFAYQLRIETHFLRLNEDDVISIKEMSNEGLNRLVYISRVIVNPIKESFRNYVNFKNTKKNEPQKRSSNNRVNHMSSPIVNRKDGILGLSNMSREVSSSNLNVGEDILPEDVPKEYHHFGMELCFMVDEEDFFYRLEKICNQVNYLPSDFSQFKKPTYYHF